MPIRNPGSECHVPGITTTLVLLETESAIPAFAMQELLNSAQQEIQRKLSTGNRHLLPMEVPWVYTTKGLRIKASFGGWDWELLNNTIEGLRYCLFRTGRFVEVYVPKIVDPRALDAEGKRFLTLLQIQANESDSPPLSDHVDRCYVDDTHTRLLYQLGDDIGAYDMQLALDGAEEEVTSELAS